MLNASSTGHRLVIGKSTKRLRHQNVDEAGSVFGCARMQLETFIPQIATGSVQRLHSEFKRKVEVADEMQEKKVLPTLTGRQIACFKSNDIRGGAIGMNDLLNIEWRSDNLKMFDRAWDETWMAMEIGPDVALLGCLYYRQLEKVDPHEECLGHTAIGSGSPERAPNRRHLTVTSKGVALQTNFAITGTIPFCVSQKRGQRRAGVTCPLVRLSEDDRPPNPTSAPEGDKVKASSSLATQGKAGRNLFAGVSHFDKLIYPR